MLACSRHRVRQFAVQTVRCVQSQQKASHSSCQRLSSDCLHEALCDGRSAEWQLSHPTQSVVPGHDPRVEDSSQTEDLSHLKADFKVTTRPSLPLECSSPE
jgi:hypothetical protein